ncbi:hypothetical protein BGZ63DRAFT_376956 [Mariannaea sp. PMI_226]|nr:hypothetical protein BGZ63DRAFT_376956 [Mariannaea sp. PMI_226]
MFGSVSSQVRRERDQDDRWQNRKLGALALSWLMGCVARSGGQLQPESQERRIGCSKLEMAGIALDGGAKGKRIVVGRFLVQPPEFLEDEEGVGIWSMDGCALTKPLRSAEPESGWQPGQQVARNGIGGPQGLGFQMKQVRTAPEDGNAVAGMIRSRREKVTMTA